MNGIAQPGTPLPVVLDSNIWIDILIFDDMLVRPIRAALETHRLQAAIDAPCREELRRVLAYPQFASYAVEIDAAMRWVDAHTRSLPAERMPDTVRLPRCRDTDDQKFIVLAHASAARYLVSKDKAVLKLDRRLTRDFGIRALTPGAFVADAGL